MSLWRREHDICSCNLVVLAAAAILAGYKLTDLLDEMFIGGNHFLINTGINISVEHALNTIKPRF